MPDRRILLVDDQPLVLSAIAHYLGQQGYEVHTAANGKDALDMMEKAEPDLVITDVVMPVMDGWKLIRSLRATPRYTLLPVIILTDQDSSESRIQGFTLGADDYVSKTTLVQELEVRINRALERSSAIARAIGIEPNLRQHPSLTPQPDGVAAPSPAAPEPRTAAAVSAAGFDLPPLAQAMAKPAPEGHHQPAPPPSDTAPDHAGVPGLQGSLDDIGLASVLTLLGSGERSGVLTIVEASTRRKARILVRAGQMLKITLDDGRNDPPPVEAVARVMRWQDATFSFSHQDVTAHDEIHANTEHLLMEASQYLDEAPI